MPTASGDGHARRSTSDDVDEFYITRGGEPFRSFSEVTEQLTPEHLQEELYLRLETRKRVPDSHPGATPAAHASSPTPTRHP
jgi:hypothetical protein